MTFIKLIPTRAGLGDQMQQYDLVYRLAQRLGAQYVHTPLEEWRMFSGVGAFTGIDLFESSVSIPEGRELWRTLQLGEMVPSDGDNPVRCELGDGHNQIAINWEYLEPSRSARLLLFLRECRPFPFRELYSRALASRPYTPGSEERAAVVVHLRFGDTVLVPFSDDRFVYVDGMKMMQGRPDGGVRAQTDVHFAVGAIKRMRSMISGRIAIVSDGFARTRRYLNGFHRSLNLTSDEVETALRTLEERLEELGQIGGVDLYVGEEELDTRRAIDLLANAERVVCTSGTFARGVSSRLGGLASHRQVSLFELAEGGRGWDAFRSSVA